MTRGDGFFERVYEVVRRIPRGRVATYGEVAAILGVSRGARAVGWALRDLGRRKARLSRPKGRGLSRPKGRGLSRPKGREIPWHRVVGGGGRISLDGRPGGELQRRRLRKEGIRFVRGRVDLARHGLLSRR
jgi:methylated-DNA-protein-cysteine methyltransferase-like protein